MVGAGPSLVHLLFNRELVEIQVIVSDNKTVEIA